VDETDEEETIMTAEEITQKGKRVYKT